MLSQWKFCFLAVAALAVVGNCQDQEPEAPDEGLSDEDPDEGLSDEVIAKIHSKIDADKDSKVSLQEMLEFVYMMRTIRANNESAPDLIPSMDSNMDGKLQLQEFLEAEMGPRSHDGSAEEKASDEKAKAKLEPTFKAADRNADGILEDQEVRYFFYPHLHDEVLDMFVTAHLKRKDQDGDGKLTPREFLEFEQDIGGGTAEISTEYVDDFNLVDKDGDGTLDAHEIKAWEEGRHIDEAQIKVFFEAADEDQDKLLTLPEFQSEYAKNEHVESVDYLTDHFHTWRAHGEL